MNSLSIKQKLTVLVLFPLILIIMISAKLILDSYIKVNELNSLEKVVVLSTKIGSLVHETQKERGMTAGFIGSKGIKFKAKLPIQRSLVDSKRKELMDELKNVDINSYSKDFSKDLDSSLTHLSNISNIRKDVSNLSISSSRALGFYTKFNSLAINLISSISKLSHDDNVSKDILSYMNFLLSKERAGIERAVMTNTFAVDSFAKNLKEKFITLVAQQNSYIDSFLKVTSDDSIDFYNKTMVGKQIDEVNRMRSIAMQANSNFDIDASYWFSQITLKINLLKKVENFLSDTLLNTIKSEHDSAKNLMLTFLTISLLGIIITIILARTIVNGILNNLRTLENGLKDFFSFINYEKNDIDLINTNSKDELGHMANLININIEKTKENINIDKQLISSTINVANEINKGNLDNKIQGESSNPSLNELKTIINEMLVTLNNNLSNITNVLDSYSNLDYRPKLENSNLQGIIKKLENNVNILGNSITTMLQENKKDGLILNENSDILASRMREISNAATSQAASLEETAASLEEITANVSSSTQTVLQMAQYGEKVKESVILGEQLANNTSKSMEAINKQTISINEAITVIDQIAFQTNILSLNAAVEAATAGEAGKGFAVVAAEVRNLASRSAEAAKEIKTLVEDAQEKAAAGKDTSSKMIEGYKELNENIVTTLSLIESVNTASKEQSLGIVQINDAINNLDLITQKNALNASDANEIAKKTKDISALIVDNVNKKEFEGKR